MTATTALPRKRTRRPGTEDILAAAGPASNHRAAARADLERSQCDRSSEAADVMASERDGSADVRERDSKARDTAAERRDLAAEGRERAHGPGSREYELAVRNAVEMRAHAATDRNLAAADRKQAAFDRAQSTIDRGRAASDREHALMDREHAGIDRREALAQAEGLTDDLTGALRRGAGRMVLQQELDRAQRSGVSLVLAFVDLDGLKATNDGDGHAAGDARLRQSISAIRSKTRRYEPIVRHGGDEFLCSIAGTPISEVEDRFDAIAALLDRCANSGSISVGLAVRRPDDTLDELIERADRALIAGRNRKSDVRAARVTPPRRVPLG
jgi:diguanylate cyclase (GGDEF)-like protein